MRYFFFIGTLVLAGCTIPNFDPSRQFAVACASYAVALDSLAIRLERGLLSEEEEARVDSLVSIATPLCDSEDPPTGSQALLDSILAELNEILAQHVAGEDV